MARRADHTREELKELAIKAGIELIRKEGISHFSARKLAGRIGYTVGTLYNVFGSYDEMILQINARTLDEWFAIMQNAMQKNGKGNPLHALARSYIKYSKTHYQEWIALFEYHLSEDRELPQWYTPKMTRFFAIVEKLLLAKLNNQRKAKRAARVLWAGIHGICILSLSGKLDLVKADSPEVLAISFIDNYIAGLTHET